MGGSTGTPAFTGGVYGTIALASYLFADLGVEGGFGLGLTAKDYADKPDYYSVCPYAHLNGGYISSRLAAYGGLGGGANFAKYSFASGDIQKNTAFMEALAGFGFWFDQRNGICVSAAGRTTFSSFSFKASAGYSRRFP